MAIVINSNISSLTAQRALGESQKMQSEAMERLSTGVRINSAKDDAAGLAIAENFTSQIRGLSQAVRNANEAVSLAQTAEGGLSETTNILQRMRELAVQASNTTLTASDRTAIQTEITALTDEIDRIANTTQYNSSNILDGTAKALSFQVGDKAGQNVSFSIADASSGGLALSTATTSGSNKLTGTVVTAMDAVNVDDIFINGKNWAGVDTSGVVHGAAVQEIVNGVQVSTTLDLAAPAAADTGAFHIAKAINSNTTQHGVVATARTEVNGVGGTGIEADMTIQVAGMAQQVVTANSMAEMVDFINTNVAGVTASLNSIGGLQLVQDEGRTITIGSAGVGTAGIADGSYGGRISLESADGTSPIEIGLGSNTNASFADLEALGFNAGTYGTADNPNAYTVVGKQILGDTAITGNSQILINGVEVPNTPSGATIITAADVANSVNQVSAQTGVTASARTELELTLDLSVFNATDNMSINGLAIAGDASTTIAELIATVESTMAAAGSDIRASAGSGANNLRLTSASGESITLLEIDANGDSNGITTVVNLTTGNDLDEAGTAAGDINEGAGHTFSGVITYTSTNGPITFSHKQLGNNALETAAQTDLNILGVRLSDPHAAASSSTATTGVDLSSAANASAAISAIDTALSTVNTIRGNLGALQNRLDHTISNLSATVENHSAARSRTMDADFAVESANLAKSQVLAQASTAMLAQANAAPQLALQLLQ